MRRYCRRLASVFLRRHFGHTRMMLATRWPSTRCTYHPALMASSAVGSLRSQCQHRPRPVEQIACRAPLTSRSEVLFALTSLMLTSCRPHLHSVTLLESGRNRQPLQGPACPVMAPAPGGHHYSSRGQRPRNTLPTANCPPTSTRWCDAAIQALIAGAVADHDGAAIGATGRVVALVDAHQAPLAHGGGESALRRGLGGGAGELRGQFRGLFRLLAIQRLNAGILAGLRVAGQELVAPASGRCNPSPTWRSGFRGWGSSRWARSACG